jgi:DNA-binding MarR family transcriptional regulator
MNRLPDTMEKPAAIEGDQMFSLLGAAHALEARLEERLGQVGLSMSKLGVLTQLVESDKALPLSELAARLSCVRSNMTQLVDRLEGDGLVRRVDDPADRRSVLAEVTDLGRSRQVAGADELTKIREQFSQLLPAADRAALGRILAALG